LYLFQFTTPSGDKALLLGDRVARSAICHLPRERIANYLEQKAHRGRRLQVMFKQICLASLFLLAAQVSKLLAGERGEKKEVALIGSVSLRLRAVFLDKRRIYHLIVF
jgi:hypothetical protein